MDPLKSWKTPFIPINDKTKSNIYYSRQSHTSIAKLHILVTENARAPWLKTHCHDYVTITCTANEELLQFVLLMEILLRKRESVTAQSFSLYMQDFAALLCVRSL